MSEKRKVGYMEMGMKLGVDFWGTGSFTAMARVTGPLTGRLVEEALGLLRARHPSLRAYFSESSWRADYLELDDDPGKIPLNIIERKGEDQWMDLMEENMAKPLTDSDRCLWRVDLLLGEDLHEIVVTFHHSISDGRSAVTFFWELLEFASDLSAGEEPEVEPLPFLPPLEEMFVKKRSWGSWLLEIVPRYAFYPAFRSAGSMLKYESQAPIDRRRSKNIYREINAEQLERLIEACHREQTTIHSLLTASVALAAHRHVKGGRGKYIYSVMSTPDCRDLCRPAVGRDHIGCYVIFAPTMTKVDERTSLWQLARDYNWQLRRSMQDVLTPVTHSKVIAKAYNGSSNYGLFKNRYVLSIPVTNIGRIDRPSKVGPFEIERFNFSVSHNWGDSIMVLYAGTLDDAMYCTFGYQDPILSSESAEGIVANTMEILESAG